jgi:sulfur carrier protein
MKIIVNGAWHELTCAAGIAQAPEPTLEKVLTELGFGDSVVATAVNGEFVAAGARERTSVRDGDRVEVLAPMQGG